MKLTLDISNKEFDGVVGAEMEVTPTIFLNFPSDIRGVYEFELTNSLVNIYDFKDQIEIHGLQIEDDSLFVFGKMKVRIEGVKGADFRFVEGDISFLSGYYASVMIIAESKHRITLTFDTDEAVPFDNANSKSILQAHSKAIKYEHTNSRGKLFNFNFFQEYLASGREAIRSE